MKKAREKILLIRIIQQKDEKSFSEVYNALVDPIYRFIFFKVNNQETAQDLTSETFFKFWKEVTDNESRQVKHLKAFIYTIARNLVIDYYRSSQKQKEVQLNAVMADKIEGDSLARVENQIDGEFIFQIIKKLKDGYQEILVLKHVEDLTLSEITTIIKKSPVATRVLLHRANQALKREYEKSASKSK